MPNALVRLPTLQYPQNALLDFSGVNAGLDSVRQAGDHEDVLDLKKRVQGMEQEKIDLSRAKLGQDKEAQERQKLAGIGQAIDQMTDPAQRQAAWQRFVGAHPAIGPTLKRYGQDPADHVNGPKFLVAEAGKAPDPGLARYREALTKSAEASAATSQFNVDKGRAEMEAEAYERMNAPRFKTNEAGELVAVSFPAARPDLPGTPAQPAQSTGTVPAIRPGGSTRDAQRRRDVQELDGAVRGQERLPTEAEIQRYWTGVYGQKAPSGQKYTRDGGLLNMKGTEDKARSAVKGALSSAQSNIDDVREALRETNIVMRGLGSLDPTGGSTIQRVMGPLRIAIRGVLHGISGAQINIPEQKEYMDAMLPNWYDRGSTIEFKLNHLEKTLTHIRKFTEGTLKDEDVLAVRNAMREGLGLKPITQEQAGKRPDARKPSDEKTRRLYDKYGLQ